MLGTCLCGDVRFEVSRVQKLLQCHCSLCRKQGGSVSNTAAIVRSEHFRWLSGRERISSFVKPTGFRSDFCSKCGSPVPNPLRETEYVWVPSGLLDGDAPLEIVAHLYVGSKASWDHVGQPGVQYDAMPELQLVIDALDAEGSETEPGEDT